ncbi:hypothetical protein [Bifidobacterium oedipodis]|uniref:Uncharacterized protein n=1 Tax=Bifidobacterium oedipodis TaxID=2675322 RepID=A0A7Y0EP72_9BIFI|nr:hypothetical protein [Bifidobacterium sp. DSM 109957]NMM93865.1 hypothetical protein [Bifidobacterium sp. DSM 109957]
MLEHHPPETEDGDGGDDGRSLRVLAWRKWSQDTMLRASMANSLMLLLANYRAAHGVTDDAKPVLFSPPGTSPNDSGGSDSGVWVDHDPSYEEMLAFLNAGGRRG